MKGETTPLPANRHVIVCGYPRAGTTLFYSMLRYAIPHYQFFDVERPAMATRGPGLICSKRPLDVFEGWKHRLFIKNPVWIILVRDMRSMLCSRHTSVPDDYFIGWNHQYHVRKSGRVSFTKPGILPVHKSIKKLSKRPQAHILRYEDLLTDPDGQQDRLCSLFGVENDPKRRFSDFHKVDIRIAQF